MDEQHSGNELRKEGGHSGAQGSIARLTAVLSLVTVLAGTLGLAFTGSIRWIGLLLFGISLLLAIMIMLNRNLLWQSSTLGRRIGILNENLGKTKQTVQQANKEFLAGINKSDQEILAGLRLISSQLAKPLPRHSEPLLVSVTSLPHPTTLDRAKNDFELSNEFAQLPAELRLLLIAASREIPRATLVVGPTNVLPIMVKHLPQVSKTIALEARDCQVQWDIQRYDSIVCWIPDPESIALNGIIPVKWLSEHTSIRIAPKMNANQTSAARIIVDKGYTFIPIETAQEGFLTIIMRESDS